MRGPSLKALISNAITKEVTASREKTGIIATKNCPKTAQ
jgi:hypothetical protein